MKQTARSGDFHHLIRRKATLVDTGLEDILELNDTFLSLKLSSEGVLGKDFEEKLKSRSETNKQIKDLLPELNRKPSSTTGVKRKGTVKPQVQDAKVAKTDFSSFRIPKVENNVAKTNHDKSGYKSFKRSGTGRQNFDKKGSNNSFRGNDRSKWLQELGKYFMSESRDTCRRSFRTFLAKLGGKTNDNWVLQRN